MTTIALLPMKAHSERVPNKNFRNIAGKPLFRWILDKLLAIEEIDRVVINTDAGDILRDFGIDKEQRVILEPRPAELCGDMVSMNLILEYDIGKHEADTYLMTHTTNPALTVDSIRRAMADYSTAVSQGEADSLFTVTRHQTRFYDSDVNPINHDPNVLLRTQDLEPWYEENSNLYLFSKDSFNSTHARIGNRPLMFEVSKLESIDIDDMDDFIIAEAILNSQREQQEDE